MYQPFCRRSGRNSSSPSWPARLRSSWSRYWAARCRMNCLSKSVYWYIERHSKRAAYQSQLLFCSLFMRISLCASNGAGLRGIAPDSPQDRNRLGPEVQRPIIRRQLIFSAMTQRVFVKVLGFSPAERHALNTLFRLSELRETVYSLWGPQAPEPPRLALVDGRSQEAHEELGPADKALKLIWIGSVAPASSWRSFERPLFWPNVIQAMDELFAPPGSLDLDLDFDDAPQTLPPGAPGWDGSPPLRALIASWRPRPAPVPARPAGAGRTDPGRRGADRCRGAGTGPRQSVLRGPGGLRVCPTWMAGRCCGRCMRSGRPSPI